MCVHEVGLELAPRAYRAPEFGTEEPEERVGVLGEDRTGKRNLWLRSLDRLGLGFDS